MSRKRRRKKVRLKQCDICKKWYSEDVIFLRAYKLYICLNCLAQYSSEELKKISKRKYGKLEPIPIIANVEEVKKLVQEDKD
mgnify:CR=1 FL=1